MSDAWWTARTTNAKTGDIPTGYIGRNVEDALASCGDCPLKPKTAGGNGGCYAWSGTPNLILRRTKAKSTRVEQLDFLDAVDERHPQARYARLGALGDPAVLSRDEVVDMREALAARRMGLLSYTHAWFDGGHHLRGLVMASCDELWEVDEAIDAGWRATVVIPADTPHRGIRTPAGRRVVVCPAQRRDDVTCNSCGACDAGKKGPIIGFLQHGQGFKGKR